MTLFENSSESYEYLIIALEKMPMKDLMMKYFCRKAQEHASIRANRPTLYDFATKWRIERGRMPKMRRMRMNSHLQRNMEHIRGAFVDESWFWEPQSTWLHIGQHLTPTRWFFHATCTWVMIAWLKPSEWIPLSWELNIR